MALTQAHIIAAIRDAPEDIQRKLEEWEDIKPSQQLALIEDIAGSGCENADIILFAMTEDESPNVVQSAVDHLTNRNKVLALKACAQRIIAYPNNKLKFYRDRITRLSLEMDDYSDAWLLSEQECEVLRRFYTKEKFENLLLQQCNAEVLALRAHVEWLCDRLADPATLSLEDAQTVFGKLDKALDRAEVLASDSDGVARLWGYRMAIIIALLKSRILQHGPEGLGKNDPHVTALRHNLESLSNPTLDKDECIKLSNFFKLYRVDINQLDRVYPELIDCLKTHSHPFSITRNQEDFYHPLYHKIFKKLIVQSIRLTHRSLEEFGKDNHAFSEVFDEDSAIQKLALDNIYARLQREEEPDFWRKRMAENIGVQCIENPEKCEYGQEVLTALLRLGPNESPLIPINLRSVKDDSEATVCLIVLFLTCDYSCTAREREKFEAWLIEALTGDNMKLIRGIAVDNFQTLVPVKYHSMMEDATAQLIANRMQLPSNMGLALLEILKLNGFFSDNTLLDLKGLYLSRIAADGGVDPKAIEYSAVKLRNYPDQSSCDGLIQCMEKSRPSVKKTAIESLMHIHATAAEALDFSKAIDPLIVLTHSHSDSESEDLKSIASQALEVFDDFVDLDHLLMHLTSYPSPNDKLAFLRFILSKLKVKGLTQKQRNIFKSQLIDILLSSDSERANEAVKALCCLDGAKDTADTLGLLMKYIDHEHPPVKEGALRGCKLILIEQTSFDPDDVPPEFIAKVIEASKDSSWKVRIECSHILARFPDCDGVYEALLRLLEDEDNDVRLAAVEGISRCDKNEALEALLPLATDYHEKVRLKVLEAISKYKDRRVQNEGLLALYDVDESVRDLAQRLLNAYSHFDWQTIKQKMDETLIWSSRVGYDILARRTIVHPYRQGLGRTMYARRGNVEIELNLQAISEQHPHGADIVRGLALHEIGHHFWDCYQPGSKTTRGIASSEGLREIYDILIDERLERGMRSHFPEYGVYFDRLASYAFAQSKHKVSLSDLAQALSMKSERLEDYLNKHNIPNTKYDPVEGDYAVELTDVQLYSLPGVTQPLILFLHALRGGIEPDLFHNEAVKEAVRLVPSNLKDITHAEVLQLARKIGDLIGRQPQQHEQLQQLKTLLDVLKQVRSLLDNIRKATDLNQIPEGVEKEMRPPQKGQNRPDSDKGPRIRESPGSESSESSKDTESTRIYEQPPKQRGKGGAGGQVLNLSQTLDFDELEQEEDLKPNFDKNAEIKASIRKHIRLLRHYFERLGRVTTDIYASRQGKRLDIQQARQIAFRPTHSLLVNSIDDIAPNLYMGVLVDRSGSMDGEKLEKAKAFAMLLAESAKGMRGIDGHINAFDHNTFYRMGNFKRNAIGALESDGGNNDAGGLQRAAQLAMASGKQNKLLVMISDGSPTRCSVESLRDLVVHLTKKQGFVCAQVAVDEIEEIAFPHFIDLSEHDFQESVTRFGKLLMRLTAPWQKTSTSTL